MLTSYDRTTWREDFADSSARDRISAATPDSVVRSYYPFKAVITKACKIYGFKEGDVLLYARTRHVVQPFPIEVTTYGVDKSPRILNLGSDEAQLLEI